MYQQQIFSMRGMSPEEYQYLEHLLAGMNDKQAHNFFLVYQSKRRNPQDLLLMTLLGFIIIAGVQRFAVNQIGMGFLYLFTGGLCLIGTIVDVINYKSLAFEYNRQAALEAARWVKSMPTTG